MDADTQARNSSFLRALTAVIGIIINVTFSYITKQLGLPFYFDTVGTVAVSFIAGAFSGVLTALFSNAIIWMIGGDSIYFAVLNVLIAVLAAFSSRYGKLKKIWGVFELILISALISGIFGGLIEYLIQYVPKIDFIFFLKKIGINMVDKGGAIILAAFVFNLIPENIRYDIWNSGWRQKPLSNVDIEKINSGTEIHSSSLRKRVFWVIILSSVIMTLIMGWISVQLYFNNSKKEQIVLAKNTAKLAAQVIDSDKIDTFIKNGDEDPEYLETETLLYGIQESVPGVKYIYVVKMVQEGCMVVFDLDTDEVQGFQVGTILSFEEAFDQYLPALFAGEEIDPVESRGEYGWVISVYEPIYDSEGECAAYVCIDVSMDYLSEYVKDFIIRSMLMFSGLLLTMIVVALWVTNRNIIYPVKSMAYCTNNFSYDGDNVHAMESNVERLKTLDIRTRDEVEDLYKALCKMTEETAITVRDMKQQSDTITNMQNGLIMTMANMVENRDSDTGAHIQKTAAYVRIVLQGLKKKGYYEDKLTEKYISDVIMSAPLHDVGKINIPDAILNKPGKLEPEEYEKMKTHTTMGKRIIEQAISTVHGESYLKEARNMAGYHHEKWDGTGYPEGLKGEAIPLSARVMAIADVFDALVSKRVYKPAFPFDKAVSIIREESGKQFDPKCVEAFLDSLDEVKFIMQKYNET